MSLIGWIVLGGLAGWVATMVTGTNHRYGVFANVLFGIVGALLGGFLASLLGAEGVNDFSIWSFILAVVGASLVIWLVNKMSSTTRTRI